MFSVSQTIGLEVFRFTLEHTSVVMYAAAELLAVLINLTLVVLIWRTGSRNPPARWFILFLFCLSLWGISEVLGRLTPTAEASIFWGRLGPPGWVFMPVVFFTFSLIFTRHEFVLDRFFIQLLLWVPALAFLFLAWNTELIVFHDPQTQELRWYGWDTDKVAPLFWFFIAWLEFYFIASLVLLFRYWRSLQEENRKKQAFFIIGGLLIPLVVGSITDAFLPIVGFAVPQTAVIFTTAMSVFVAYALLKYKLFILSPLSAFANIIDTMSEILLVLTPDGYIDRMSRAGLEALGYQKEDLIDQPIEKLIPPGPMLNTFRSRALGPLYDGKNVKNLETKFITRDGLEINVNFSASPVKERGERLAGIVAVASDITQTKRLIRNLEQSTEELRLAKYNLERQLSRMTEAR